MKKGVIIAVAAGVVIAGLAGFLFGTEKGRKVTRQWRSKGEELAGQVEDFIRKPKEKSAALKEAV